MAETTPAEHGTDLHVHKIPDGIIYHYFWHWPGKPGGTTIFEDRTIKRLIVGIVAGLALGMVLDIVLVVFRGSAYMPAIFVLVLIIVLAVLVRWAKGQE